MKPLIAPVAIFLPSRAIPLAIPLASRFALRPSFCPKLPLRLDIKFLLLFFAFVDCQLSLPSFKRRYLHECCYQLFVLPLLCLPPLVFFEVLPPASLRVS